MKTFGDLTKYLEEKCDFHLKDSNDPASVTWTCSNELRFVASFCKEHNLDYRFVRELLERNGGFCDCEVLFNCVERISEATYLPAKVEA